MMGQTWQYRPPGFKEAPPQLKDHAYSFESRLTAPAYAIKYDATGGCFYRTIFPDDYSNDWEDWATKFDGVSDSTMGCTQA
ncbi:hypothetical protein BC940DRAFT_290813 [Gongronella butleri]|nr:hypothetical protein BC940DRAFT_290813 [Gongronella butleri]